MDIMSSVSPPMSFGIRVQATVGRNQVQRNVGQYSALYQAPSSAIDDSYVEIPPNGVWLSDATKVYNVVVASCSGPLKIEASNGVVTSFVATVNRMFVWDSPLTSVKFTNMSATDTVRLSLHTVTVPAP